MEDDVLSDKRRCRIVEEDDEREMVVVEVEFEDRVKTWRRTTQAGNAYCCKSTLILVCLEDS
jgi:hypothetical protein